MANTQGITAAAKQAALAAVVDGKTLKGALYLASASVGPATAAYTATGEVSGTNYTAGGAAVTNANTAALDGTVAHWTPSADITWSTVTLATAFDALLLYSTTDTNRSIGVFTFGSQTITAGDFTLTMPTNDGTSGLVRLS
ncbi:MAG TPA: hypothetical protein PKH90_12530 [Candidatus Desulfobacillus denitrificans]|nr:hypothetical protein [Candidatus Desulfobacillus denitrificans]